MRLDLDSPVACADGAFGELADVVIDPHARRVTHLVVREHGRPDLARLVPVDQAGPGQGSHVGVQLKCTIAEVKALESIQRSEYVRLDELPVKDSSSDVGIEETFQPAVYGPLGMDTFGAGMMEPTQFDPHVTVSYDRIPKGTVEIRGASDVTSADGHHVGHVVGVVIDEQAQIAQLVLEHGHLWFKRELAIPNRSIDRIESDAIVLSLSHDQVTS